MSIPPVHLCTYLNFPGTCRDAFSFYEQHLGGKVVFMMTHGQSPEPGILGHDWTDAILHARIDIGDSMILGADIPNAQPVRSAYLTLYPGSIEETERVYAALSEGGQVTMPIAETFFAYRFAQLRDQFGTLWMLIHERPMPQND